MDYAKSMAIVTAAIIVALIIVAAINWAEQTAEDQGPTWTFTTVYSGTISDSRQIIMDARADHYDVRYFFNMTELESPNVWVQPTNESGNTTAGYHPAVEGSYWIEVSWSDYVRWDVGDRFKFFSNEIVDELPEAEGR